MRRGECLGEERRCGEERRGEASLLGVEREGVAELCERGGWCGE